MSKLRETLKYLARGINSIAEGAASLLDIGATRYSHQIHSRRKDHGLKEDIFDTYNDWRAIGRDLESAMGDFEIETGCVPKQP